MRRPSRAQLLTGRLPPRTGVTKNFIPESLNGLAAEEHTIASLLKPAGYDTAQLGKCVFARARAKWALARGRGGGSFFFPGALTPKAPSAPPPPAPFRRWHLGTHP